MEYSKSLNGGFETKTMPGKNAPARAGDAAQHGFGLFPLVFATFPIAWSATYKEKPKDTPWIRGYKAFPLHSPNISYRLRAVSP